MSSASSAEDTAGFVARVLVDDQDAPALTPGAEIAIPHAAMNHVARVLRLADGDAIELTDGAGRVATGVLAGERVHIAEVRVVERPSPLLILLQSLCGKDRLEEAVRAAVEVGIDRIELVHAARSDAPYAARPDKLRGRLARIVRSAVEQSRRAYTPQLCGPHSLADALAHAPTGGWVGALDGPPPVAAPSVGVDPVANHTAVALAVGPESGFTEPELSQLQQHGIAPVRLPTPVLRVEHAAPILCAFAITASARMDHRDW